MTESRRSRYVSVTPIGWRDSIRYPQHLNLALNASASEFWPSLIKHNILHFPTAGAVFGPRAARS